MHQKKNLEFTDLQVFKLAQLVNEYIRFLKRIKNQTITLIDSSLIDYDDITQKINLYKQFVKELKEMQK